MNMKKIVFITFLVILTSAVFAQEAEIIEVTGTVEVQRVKGGGRIAAEPGMKIQSGDLVSTGFKSTAQLKIGDTVLTVRPLTRLTLEELVQKQGGNSAGITLQSGRVRTEVAAPNAEKKDFTIRAPSATASVRGEVYEEDGVYLEE
jgi:hypothetical protein